MEKSLSLALSLFEINMKRKFVFNLKVKIKIKNLINFKIISWLSVCVVVVKSQSVILTTTMKSRFSFENYS